MSHPLASHESSVPALNCTFPSFFCCIKIKTQHISPQCDALPPAATSHFFPACYTHTATHTHLSLRELPCVPQTLLLPLQQRDLSPGGLCFLQAHGSFLRSIRVWGVKEEMRGVSASPPAPGLRASHGMRRQRPVPPCVSCSCLQNILIVHSQQAPLCQLLSLEKTPVPEAPQASPIARQ